MNSEKERNLYYKFFAGYFFNELVPGIETRLADFCRLLNNCTLGGISISQKVIELTLSNTHVSFDNYGYLFAGIDVDRGEFADILIQDHSKRVIIPIEAKVHSNWSYEKDIMSNEKRLGLIEENIRNLSIHPCLLLTKAKWHAAAQQESREHSNYKRLIESSDCRTRVIFWEDLVSITEQKQVRTYIEDQLRRPERGFRYKFIDEWYARD